MGNAESTTRMVAMQRDPGGDIVISEAVLEHLKGNRGQRIQLSEGEKVIHEDDLQAILDRKLQEGMQRESIRFRTEVQRLKDEKDILLIQQAQEREQVIAETESKWKLLLEETTEKEKEALRVQLEEKEKLKVNQLEAHWQLVLEETKKGQTDAELKAEGKYTKQEITDLESKYNILLEEQLKNEKEALHLQLEEESNQKLQEAELRWKATLMETAEQAQREKEELQSQMEEQSRKVAEAIVAQWEETLREKLENVTNEKDLLLGQIEEKGRKNLEEVETKWQQIFQEATGKDVNSEDTKSLIDEIEAKWMSKLEEKEKEHIEKIKNMDDVRNLSEQEEAVNSVLQKVLEEKEALLLQLTEENSQKLEEAEAKWKVTLMETTEQAQKEKEELQSQLEGQAKKDAEALNALWEETLSEKLNDARTEKEAILGQIEKEGKRKMQEVEAKWQHIFQEAIGKDVHIDTVEEGKALIDEIEERWLLKLAEKEREHMDKVKGMEENHINETNLSDSKFLEQEKLVNAMLEKLQQVESREDGIRQKFITSALKMENQLRPHKQKAVCTESLNTALDCHKMNTKRPLLCSEEVKKFKDCVELERIALLNRNATK